MASPKQVAKNIAKLGVSITLNVDKAVRKTALAIVQVVTVGTPKKTGRAASNWDAEIDARSLAVRESFSQGNGAAAAAAAIKLAKSVIKKYNGDKHTEIHLTNNLDYIKPLNEGTSAQAPAGFVQKGILIAVRAIKGTRVLP